MIALALVALALTVLVLVCLLALVDQYRTLELVREHLGINDTPRPIAHAGGRIVPSELGLPGHLDDARHLVILFLSTSCTTCRTVATALRAKGAPSLHVTIRAPSERAGLEWCQDVGLAPERCTVDVGGRVAAALEVTVTPAAVVVRDEAVVIAQTVPSYRQLEPLLTGRVLAGARPGPTPQPQEH